MPYLVIVALGVLFLTVGLLSNTLLRKSARKYANGAPTESGSEMRDRTIGLALFYTWLSIAFGAVLVLLAAVLYVEGVFD